jgi:hypothetical protein
LASLHGYEVHDEIADAEPTLEGLPGDIRECGEDRESRYHLHARFSHAAVLRQTDLLDAQTIAQIAEAIGEKRAQIEEADLLGRRLKQKEPADVVASTL